LRSSGYAREIADNITDALVHEVNTVGIAPEDSENLYYWSYLNFGCRMCIIKAGFN
jgi:hypothetical protein